ncbi:MAG TPA: class I SAM-dependent methyltransferase [Nitrososphaeraceae archaeon]|jgi:ubiquinone/menaquinone biosynthesis C-methylase UbiE
MKPTSSDTSRSNIGQSPIWNSTAQGYRKWWPHIEKAAQSLSNRLVELAEIRAGQRILDIATGIGEPALTAARIVGRTGHVLAIDISTEMLAIAKQRAIYNGLQNTIEYKETASQDLMLPDLSFNAVLCRWGLMFLPNLDSTLIEIHRSMLPGGKFVAAVWADAQKVPVISLAMQSIAESVRGATKRFPSLPNPYSLSDEYRLTNLFIEAGFGNVRTGRVTITYEFASGDDYSQYCQAISASASLVLSNESDKTRKLIWKNVADRATLNYTNTNGTITMDNECICVVGTKL